MNQSSSKSPAGCLKPPMQCWTSPLTFKKTIFLIVFPDFLGQSSFAPIKYDVRGLIKSLKIKYSTHPESYKSIQDIIDTEEKSGKFNQPNSTTMSLIWLTRHLMFLHNFLREFVESENSVQNCLSLAYESTLKPHHDQVIRSVFAVSFPLFSFFVHIS
jgi:hypothetical protein